MQSFSTRQKQNMEKNSGHSQTIKTKELFIMEEVIALDTNWTKLVEQAREIQNDCSDVIAKANTLRMNDELNLIFGDKKMPMSAYATSGLCGKLKIPVVYFNRCATEFPELAAQNINKWLSDDPRELMLRTYKDSIRGCLSASYSKFDAPEILDAMDDALHMENYKVKGSFINEERLHVRIIEKNMLPIEGEDLFAGFTLDSSDIGRSGLYVRFFIYKQVCTNGLVLPKSSGELFRQKHIGISSEEFKKGLIEGFESFNEIKNEVVEMIKRNKQIPTGEDIEDLIKNRLNVTDEVVDEILMLADTSYDRSKWGIINGITEVAQKFSLERRLQLEQIAGEMLTE